MELSITYINVFSNNSIDTHTVLHMSDFGPNTLCPSQDLIKTEGMSYVPDSFKKKKQKTMLLSVLNTKPYYVWRKRLTPEAILKYAAVANGTFKPSNLFETFLQEHDLLNKAVTTGVEVCIATTSTETSKSFGSRDFNNLNNQVYFLENEPSLSKYYKNEDEYMCGSVYSLKRKSSIRSVDGIPWPAITKETEMSHV